MLNLREPWGAPWWFWIAMALCGLVLVFLMYAGVADSIAFRDCAAACAPASPVLRGPIGVQGCFCDDSVMRPTAQPQRDGPCR